MASATTKPLAMLSRPTTQLLRTTRSTPLAAAAGILRSYATPAGPPPSNFRLPKPQRWDERKDSALDQAGRFFLLTELARGMYVVLEQYFRPPYVQILGEGAEALDRD